MDVDAEVRCVKCGSVLLSVDKRRSMKGKRCETKL